MPPPILYEDPSDPYSKALSSDLFSYTSNIDANPVHYTVEHPETLDISRIIKDATTKHQYDEILFAGYTDDLNTLENNLRNQLGENIFKMIHIIGEEGLYDLGEYDNGNYSNLVFTTEASYAQINSTNLSLLDFHREIFNMCFTGKPPSGNA